MSERSIRARVKKGARLLDERRPGWVNEFIESGKNFGFDLSDPGTCVLGNVFRKAAESQGMDTGFEAGVNEIIDGDEHSPSDFGFDRKYGKREELDQWNILSDQWQEEILNRTDLKGQVIEIFKKEESNA